MSFLDKPVGEMSLADLTTLIRGQILQNLPPIPAGVAQLDPLDIPLVAPDAPTDQQVLKYQADVDSWIPGDGSSLPPAPPSGGFAPLIQSGIGSLFVTWTVPDGGGTDLLYDVHCSDSDGFTPGPTNLVGTTPGGMFVIKNLEDGTALDYGQPKSDGLGTVPYYVVIVAYNTEGSITSSQQEGAPRQATVNDLAVDSVTADQVKGNQILAGKLEAQLALESQIIATSDLDNPQSVQNVTIDSTGITLFDGSTPPQIIVQIPTDSNKAVSFKGQADLSAVSIEGNLTLRGTTNIMDNSSQLLLTDKQADPTNPPAVDSGYDTLGISGGTNDDFGAWFDGTHFYRGGTSAAGRPYIKQYLASTGAYVTQVALEAVPAHVIFGTFYGIWGDGSNLYAIVYYGRANGDGSPYAHGDLIHSFQIDKTTLAATVVASMAEDASSGSIFSADGQPTTAYDAASGQLYLVGYSSGGSPRIWRLDPTTLSTGNFVNLAMGSYTIAGVGGSLNPYDGPNVSARITAGGTAGIGTVRVALQSLNGDGVDRMALGDIAFNTTAGTSSFTTAYENVFTSSCWGIASDGSNDWVIGDGGDAIYKLTSFSLDLTKDWYFGYAWEDQTGAAAATLTSISNASPAVFTLVGHGLSVGDEIELTTTGSLPTGLLTGTRYFVISAGFSTSAFEVSLTRGGTAINTSSGGSGTQKFIKHAETAVSTFTKIGKNALRNLGRFNITVTANGSLYNRFYAANKATAPGNSDEFPQTTQSGNVLTLTSLTSSGSNPLTATSFPGTGTSTIKANAAAATAGWIMRGDGAAIFSRFASIPVSPTRAQVLYNDNYGGLGVYGGPERDTWRPIGDDSGLLARHFDFSDDFLFGPTVDSRYGVPVAGGAAIGATNLAGGAANPGQVMLATGTTASSAGTAAIRLGNSSKTLSPILIGSGLGQIRMSCVWAINAIGTPFVEVYWGLVDDTFVGGGGGAPTGGYFFKWNGNVNSGKPQYSAGAATSLADAGASGALAANTFYLFEIEIDALGTTARFYLNGSLIKTATSITAPTNTLHMEFCVNKITSSGTTRNVSLDAWAIAYELTTHRYT